MGISNCFDIVGTKKVVPMADLQIHNIALGEKLVDPSERTIVKMTYFK